MVGWHHQLEGCQSEQALGADGRQGSPACCSPWVPKESDTTDRLNNSARDVGDTGLIAKSQTELKQLSMHACKHISTLLLSISGLKTEDGYLKIFS